MVFSTLNGIFFVSFLLSIVVQFNDPDPVRWIIFYSVATFFCVLAMIKVNTFWPGLAALAYLGGVVYYMPGWSVDTLKLLMEPKMSTNDVELAREAIGLLICAVWMIVLTVRWARSPDESPTGASLAKSEELVL